MLLSGIKNLGLRLWVKRGFSSAATSTFYIFSIRRSAFYPRPSRRVSSKPKHQHCSLYIHVEPPQNN